MRDRRPTNRRKGQLPGADMGAASKLASWLPGYGLEKLTDAEATRLMEFMNFLDSMAASEGFHAGWRAAQRYNDDVLRLTMAPPTMTQH